MARMDDGLCFCGRPVRIAFSVRGGGTWHPAFSCIPHYQRPIGRRTGGQIQGVLLDDGRWVMEDAGETRLWTDYLVDAEVAYSNRREVQRVADEVLAASPAPPWAEICAHLFGHICDFSALAGGWFVAGRVLGAVEPDALIIETRSGRRYQLRRWEYCSVRDKWPELDTDRTDPNGLDEHLRLFWIPGRIPELLPL